MLKKMKQKLRKSKRQKNLSVFIKPGTSRPFQMWTKWAVYVWLSGYVRLCIITHAKTGRGPYIYPPVTLIIGKIPNYCATPSIHCISCIFPKLIALQSSIQISTK
jgi:hypothetical protein